MVYHTCALHVQTKDNTHNTITYVLYVWWYTLSSYLVSNRQLYLVTASDASGGYTLSCNLSNKRVFLLTISIYASYYL